MSNPWPKGQRPACPTCPSHGRAKPNTIGTRGSTQCHQCYCDARRKAKAAPLPDAPAVTRASDSGQPLHVRVLLVLRTGGQKTLDTLAATCQATPGQVLDALLLLERDQHVNFARAGDSWALAKVPDIGSAGGVAPYVSRPDGSFVFGAISDTHLGSKYARLDVLADLYRRFEAAGVDRVYHAGNWIDGEDERKNKYDLLVHGMDGQIEYMANVYPVVPDLTTYAVAGNDHEGWYGQREGINIGAHAEALMQKAGRRDWMHLGHMEAFVPLQHADSGAQSMLHVMHPGGGSSYAVSYTIQKIVEGYEGGDKPAVLLAGHYHKLCYLVTRNVYTLQTGCTQDLTPWARSKKLRYEIGGSIVWLQQDAASGAITSCKIEIVNYFNRGFYQNDRWSHGGDVHLVPRSAA